MDAAGGGIAILPTAPERTRNRDAHYPYRHDSYFYYLSGFREPEAVLVLIAGDAPKQILFCREKNEEREIWDGYRHGPEAASALFGFDEAWTIGELEKRLPDLLANQAVLWCGLGYDNEWDARIMTALNAVRANARTGVTPPHSVRDLRADLDEMRLIKDASELNTMRRAASISAAAHCRAMQQTQPGRFEYEIEAELLHAFRSNGSQAPAYTSIVASGANACVLHYVENERRMRDGELLLIDAGCELDGYASDITRTFPVNGRFSGPQRDVYELVLASQHAAKAAIRPFYMHRTGHWLGMDVHDAGEYKLAGEWRPLEPGMVLTVEPGCYIRPSADVPEAFWNIGIRIEDDAVVTAEGCEYITDGVPREIDQIEALMRDQADAAA